MTFTETLQIKERYLQFEDLRALDYCEKRWKQDGCPAKGWELVNFIERMLRELLANGVGYPKVLLLRKKEIQRGTFTPQESACTGSSEEVCPLCRGTGWKAIEHGPMPPSYAPCTCKTGSVRQNQIFEGRRQTRASG
jgi:hypothetical protein